MSERQCRYGHPVADDAAFCPRCGFALDPVPPRCPNGHAVTAGAGFCTTCGIPVPASVRSGPAAPPPWPPPSTAPSTPLATPAPAVTFVPATPYARPPLNNLAIAAFLLSWIWFYGLTSIAAIVLAVRALRQCRERGERGKPLAVWAIIIGSIGALIAVGVLAANA